MTQDPLHDNVVRLLRGEPEAPSREFEARMGSLLAGPDRKRAMLPAIAVAAAVAMAVLVWSAGRNLSPVVPVTQDAKVPWRTDVAATREEARRAGKPCVVLFGIEGDVNGVSNVETSLRKSQECRGLCAKVPVAAIRREDPADEELRKSFGLEALNPWLAVYDAKGELLGARCAMPNGMLREDGPRYPALIVGVIEEILARTESMEELERRWKAGSLDEKLLEPFFVRLGEMWAYKRLAEVSESVLKEEQRPARTRDLARFHWYIGEVCGMPHREQKNHGAIAVIGQRLLVETKDPVLLEKLAELVWCWGFQEEFDVSARVDAALKRMSQDAGSENAVQALSSYSRKQMAAKEEELRKLPPGESFERAFLCAQLGRAAETVEFFEKQQAGSHYDQWLREAREKLARERK